MAAITSIKDYLDASANRLHRLKNKNKECAFLEFQWLMIAFASENT